MQRRPERDRFLKRCGLIASALLVGLLAGCSLKVDKGKNGENKDVDIHLPMGGLHVQHDTTTAEDTGLPGYPGASLRKDADGEQSANLHLGFGKWQLHVRVAKYQTPDPQAKVMAYYRNALGRYGTVLECRDGTAVGGEKITREGLSCDDKHSQPTGVHTDTVNMQNDLRAGSKHHQHIVGFGPTLQGQTAFTLVAIDLPQGLEKKDSEE